MSSISVKQSDPPSGPTETATVQLHALSAGYLTLPERYFVYPASKTARNTVPSLGFLIQHQDNNSGRNTCIVFDLGLRRDLQRYPEPIRRHATTRLPITTDPDVVKSLAKGGLTPEDIDYVIFSHVHWDHVGEPRDFTRSKFVVGPGASKLLQGNSESLRGSHSFFEADLVPESRTIELSDLASDQEDDSKSTTKSRSSKPDFSQQWTTHLNLPHVIDLFHDGSLYLVNAPGHLPGHINLLARTAVHQSVYLAGDACHDRRILRREKEIGTWEDAEGHACCIHADRRIAEQTIEWIRGLELQGVEVIFAHDVEWESDPVNKHRFWGSDE